MRLSLLILLEFDDFFEKYLIVLDLLLCHRFQFSYLQNTIEGGIEGIADVGKAIEGFLETLELMVEEIEELGGVHCIELVSEPLENSSEDALPLINSVGLVVRPTEALIAAGGGSRSACRRP